MNECPHCGGGERLGVWLSRTSVEIFDKIKRAGDAGCTWDQLGRSRHAVKANIYHMNALLEETDYVIRSERGPGLSCWKLYPRAIYQQIEAAAQARTWQRKQRRLALARQREAQIAA